MGGKKQLATLRNPSTARCVLPWWELRGGWWGGAWNFRSDLTIKLALAQMPGSAPACAAVAGATPPQAIAFQQNHVTEKNIKTVGFGPVDPPAELRAAAELRVDAGWMGWAGWAGWAGVVNTKNEKQTTKLHKRGPFGDEPGGRG